MPQFVIIADTFPPNRNSGAVQLRDLSKQMVNIGCKLTIIVPNNSGLQPITIDARGQLTIIRIRLSALGENNLFRRAIREHYALCYAVAPSQKHCLARKI